MAFGDSFEKRSEFGLDLRDRLLDIVNVSLIVLKRVQVAFMPFVDRFRPSRLPLLFVHPEKPLVASRRTRETVQIEDRKVVMGAGSLHLFILARVATGQLL
jgi:hypothetical protein